jgi:protein kinase A
METSAIRTTRHKFSESELEVSNPKLLKLDDYDITELIGTGMKILFILGSFARVKLAKEKNTNKYFAVKIMKKEDLINLGQVNHTKSELKILNFVKHPFIVIYFKSFT